MQGVGERWNESRGAVKGTAAGHEASQVIVIVGMRFKICLAQISANKTEEHRGVGMDMGVGVCVYSAYPKFAIICSKCSSSATESFQSFDVGVLPTLASASARMAGTTCGNCTVTAVITLDVMRRSITSCCPEVVIFLRQCDVKYTARARTHTHTCQQTSV